MKRILIVLLLVMTSNTMANALQCHFLDNKVTRENGSKLLVELESRETGYEAIRDLLGELKVMPSDYSRFYRELTQKNDRSEPDFIDVVIDEYSPEGIATWGPVRKDYHSGWGWSLNEKNYSDRKRRLTVDEYKLNSVAKSWAMGEEQILFKTKLYACDEVQKTISQIDLEHIKVYLEVIPSILVMKCKREDKKNVNCWFVDEKDQRVEELVLRWNVSYPQDLLKKLQQETQEIKRAQAERKQLLEKECPNLYRTLYNAQQGYYVDPIVGTKVAQRFEELECEDWVQMYQ